MGESKNKDPNQERKTKEKQFGSKLNKDLISGERWMWLRDLTSNRH